jgi:type IV pilus assembly protein PilV
MKARSFQRSQRGVLLIEVLISIVIFAIGILSMISMQAVSVAAQNDSQYRAEAEHLIDQLTSQIRIAVTHNAIDGNVVPASFAAFAHRADAATACNSADAGTASASSVVTDWLRTVQGLNPSDVHIAGKGLPGVVDPLIPAGAPRVRILADSTMPGINQLRVTICWQAANDKTAHSHSVVAYID